MSPDHLDDDQTPDQDPVMPPDDTPPEGGVATDTGDEEQQPLDLTVGVDSPSACERHVTVTVSTDDIARYRDKAISEMMPTAAVPGFRPGRAPRKLVEQRFHKDVDQQLKGSLLVDSMTQVSEEQHFAAISEPDFDLEAVEIPADGPMTFEFDIEVRPEFDMPEWKGLLVERPIREFDDQDVDRRLQEILAPHGELVPCDRAIQLGDYFTTNITVLHDDEEVMSAREQVVRVAAVLSFQDGKIEGFADLMAGARPGETRQTEMELTSDAVNESLRGVKVTVRFEVLDVKQLRMPELTAEFLGEMGDFDSEEGLRDAVRKDLERKLAYYQAQQIRRQITAALTAAADWDLPPGLLQRQSARELERTTMELRRSGFSEPEIRTRENELRQNSTAATARSLKEHFILERIAEEEEIDASNDDFEMEVSLLAMQSGDSPRRVRAQIEKRGMMDVLRNQIIERKVIELVRSHARFQDEPFEQDEADVEAIDVAAGGVDEPPIPEATQGSVES